MNPTGKLPETKEVQHVTSQKGFHVTKSTLDKNTSLHKKVLLQKNMWQCKKFFTENLMIRQACLQSYFHVSYMINPQELTACSRQF